jgi:hypothetical protein
MTNLKTEGKTQSMELMRFLLVPHLHLLCQERSGSTAGKNAGLDIEPLPMGDERRSEVTDW